jgi:hypothetical protein
VKIRNKSIRKPGIPQIEELGSTIIKPGSRSICSSDQDHQFVLLHLVASRRFTCALQHNLSLISTSGTQELSCLVIQAHI